MFILFTHGAIAAEQSQSEPWSLIERQLHKNLGLAASEITSAFELPGDDGPVAGFYKTHIQQWDKNGTPIRSLLRGDESNERSYKRATLDLSLATRFANHPETLFQRPDLAVTLGTEQLNNRMLDIYEIRSRFTNGTLPITAKIWFDPTNGTLIKVIGTIRDMPVPGVKSANFILTYNTDKDGRSLPAKLQVDYTISLFFHTGKVLFSQEFLRWEKHPE
ncbi:hypothetical protein [Duganella vulcania]|uniref:Uncharacterized protein n=1 Tax=Duganella vulcania TaxID=2692166 RepID=A0A845GW56_9BURK|nr:hypothetical protein [Duganella vulcania]MYM97488.1 hypothetical protein [Duganella vulcania]